jgi:Uma2 family endonuclease
MSLAEVTGTPELAEPRLRKWTREEYHQFAEMGLFQDQRVELVDGEIIQMAPQKEPHAASISLAQAALISAFGAGYWVRPQMPLFFDDLSEPEPDLAVIKGNPRDYAASDNPRSALLVVEVSVATLRYDRTRKANLYAAAGIEDYWILNVVDRQLEVHRDRLADASHKFGWRYQKINIVRAGDLIIPLARPDAKLAVNDLLL